MSHAKARSCSWNLSDLFIFAAFAASRDILVLLAYAASVFTHTGGAKVLPWG